MLSKKFLGIMTSLFLLAGVGTTPTATRNNSVVPNYTNYTTSYEKLSNTLGAPTDLAMANEDKVIEMLKSTGTIPKDASFEQAHEIYVQYMRDLAAANENVAVTKTEKEFRAKQAQRPEKYAFEQSTTDTNPKKVNILVLLADFADYKHSNIQPSETAMYYKDYSHQHYQDMIFGDNGYVGPDGKNYISMKQYYAQQSGGSLDVEGTVAGWYTLPQTAAWYGQPYGSSNDRRPRNAVADLLTVAAKDPNLNLADYDKEDIYDIDGDGDFNEPDGIIDYLMVLHAGVGQEAGGGQLGANAIWSHSWDLGGIYTIPGTSTDVPYWGGKLGAFHYTIEPEDGATGVFAHEFGHNLGLPDEYDIAYSSSAGEPISMWSIMSSGSWGGTIGGTEPTGFSPYAKQIFQNLYGGNWQKLITLDYNDLTSTGAQVTLRQADEQGQAVRINLPKRSHVLVPPASGKYSYWGGTGVDGTAVLTNMTANVNLVGKTTATLKFKTNYDIEKGWDFASIQVREVGTTNWTYLPGNNGITTTEHDPDADVVIPYGITGTSNGWVNATFDLSSFAGKNIELKLEYATDKYSFGKGFYVDEIQVVTNNSIALSDNAEGTPVFALNGFSKNTGLSEPAENYYLIEWRNHHGVDTGLAHIGVLGQNLSYEPGMVVWYADKFYGERDNLTGAHPGDGYLGIVDADQSSIRWKWSNGTTGPMLASGRYQMRDAAFSRKAESALTINTNASLGRSPLDPYRYSESIFTDSKSYLNSEIAPLGRNIPHLGVNIQITKQADNNSSATILIKK